MSVWQEIVAALSGLSLLQWALTIIINGMVFLAFRFIFFRWLFRREWRFYQNLKRPVIVLRPQLASGAVVPGGEMTSEIRLLKRSGFLNISSDMTFQSFNPAGEHCVVVLGYLPEMTGLDDILDRLKSNHVPLIVYTYGINNAFTPDIRKKFESYPVALNANFPLTLLNHIFTTVATYPYEGKAKG